jgi:hypothetical protein
VDRREAARVTVDSRGRWARDAIPFLAGVAALATGTAFGWDSRLVGAIVTPPALVRAVLAGTAVVAALWLLARSVRQIGAARATDDGRPNLRLMVRGVRLAFLAVAAASASAGWVLGHPLPIVIALVIAGVDVVETSFLLLVSAPRR